MFHFLLFFLPGVIESAGIIACVMALVMVKLRWGIIMSVASVFTVVIYLIRHMPITFGLHTIVVFLLLVMFMARLTRVSTSSIFMASFGVFATLALLELLMMELWATILKTDISNLASDYLLWKLTSFPQGALMIAMALLITKIRTPLEGMWRI